MQKVEVKRVVPERSSWTSWYPPGFFGSPMTPLRDSTRSQKPIVFSSDYVVIVLKDCQSPNPCKIYVKHMRPFFTAGKLRPIPVATSVSKDPSGRFPSIQPSMQRSNGANKLHTVSKHDNHRASFRIRELEGPVNSM